MGKGIKSVFWDNWNDYSRNSSMATQIFAGILGLAAMAAVAYFAAPLLLASVGGLGTAAAFSAAIPGAIGILGAGVAAFKVTTELVKTGIGGISDGIKRAGQSMDERAIKNEAKKETKQEKKEAKAAAKVAEKEAKEAEKKEKKENNIRDAKLEALTTDLDKQSKKEGKGGASGMGTKHENAAKYYSDKMSRLVEVTANSFGEDLSKLSGKQLAELSKAIKMTEQKGIDSSGKNNVMTKETKDRLDGVQTKINEALKADTTKIGEFTKNKGTSEVVTEQAAAQKNKTDITTKFETKLNALKGKETDDLISKYTEIATKIGADLDPKEKDEFNAKFGQEIQNITGVTEFQGYEYLDFENMGEPEKDECRMALAKYEVLTDAKAEKFKEQKAAKQAQQEQEQTKEANTKAAIDDIMSALAGGGVSVSDAKGQATATSAQAQGHGQSTNLERK